MGWTPPPADGIEVPQWICQQPLDRKERPPWRLRTKAAWHPETERSGQRALTVRALDKREPHDIGSISQYVLGYAGRADAGPAW